MKRILRPLGIGSATTLIAISSLISYGIGLFRDRIIAAKFGTTSEADAFNSSFLIPDIIFNLFIASALMAAFMPIFSKYLDEDKEEAFKIGNTVLTIGTIFIGILAAIAFIFMESIIINVFPHATDQVQVDIISMTRIILGSAILFCVSNTLGNILMSYKHFFSYSFSPIFYNIGIILGVVLLSDKYGIYSAAYGVLIGALLHTLIRLIDIKTTDYKYYPRFDIKNPNFKKILKLMVPKSLSLIGWQINLYIYAFVGMKITEGGFAAFNYARNIQSFAVSLFGISFATAVFPFLNQTAAKEKKIFTIHVQDTIQRSLFFTLPAAIGLMFLSEEIVRIILQGGIFQEKSVALTVTILFYFALSIPFESLVHILARAFYAHQNTVTPMIINILAMTVIAITTIFIAPKYGIQWFSIGFTAGFMIQVGLLGFLLKKKLHQFNGRKLIIFLGKIMVSSGIMSILILLIDISPLSTNILLGIFSKLIIAMLAYFTSSYLLKIEEIRSIKSVLNRIISKN